MTIPAALAVGTLIAVVTVAGTCADVETAITIPPRSAAALEVVNLPFEVVNRHRAVAPVPVIISDASDSAVKPVQYSHKLNASHKVELDMVLYQAHVEWVDSRSICPESDDADFKPDAKKPWPHVAMN